MFQHFPVSGIYNCVKGVFNRFRTIVVCLVACVGCLTRAQTALPTFGSPLSANHTQSKLILSADTAKPGDTIWAGVDMKMDKDWHTYWKNPGAAGMATKIEWQLPAGVAPGEIQWPLPEKFPPVEVTTYGYEKEVVLLVPLTLASNLPAGPLDLKAKVSWLECKDVCVPANQDVEAKLNIGSETKNSTDAATIEMWQNKIPALVTNGYVNAWWEKSASDDTRPIIIEWSESLNGRMPVSEERLPTDTADFYPDASDQFEIQSATENIPSDPLNFRIRKLVKKFSGDWPKQISGIIIMRSGGAWSTFVIKLSISDQAPAGVTISTTPESRTRATPALPLMLLYAFIGGLILNIMPCVLPVIALKILGFVGEARSEPRRVRNLGLIYALGVLVSFLTLAAIVIGVKSAGHHAGWGMQFGSPVFVVCLTTLVTLVALNLFGVFEVTPGGKVMNAAGLLASKHGAPGAFFNGLLATALATPCTAPFLAPALGFAFAQTEAVIVLVFLTIGLGLAAPYVLLSCNPALLKFLPKPGAWMEKFKIAMGFPMLATVVWLFNVAAADYGARVFWLGIFLVVIALAAWVFGEFVQRGRNAKGLALAIALILLIGGYAFALENRLHWREMISETDTANSTKSAGAIAWQPWSPEAVAAARTAGKPVLVDFTATWCVTCNAIIKPALENESVVSKLKALDAVTLLADYTRTPQAMTDEISKYGGAGVPLVLVYPKNPDATPVVLPQPSPLQLPSSYSKIVLDALDRAAR
jgi:thiol:disulfide interchange protein/DsbC/DsbD-like thiol-disulfide interchange protein